MSRPTVMATARSHIGSVRTVNEDRLLNDEWRCLWAIADGMGGHSRGDMAAQLVVSALGALGVDEAPITSAVIDRAMRDANDELFALNGRAGSQSGATVAGMALDDAKATIFWAGDSRVYRWRTGAMTQLTRDDRVVQEMIEAGVITAQQARRHPRATVITRAVGATETIELSYRHEDLAAGDTFLICSDGLTDLVEEDEIEAALAGDIDDAVSQLIRRALVQGGHDNVSIVIVRVMALAPSLPKSAEEAAQCATRF
jgi:serine/threonine protein phosphatase PrpC